MGAGGEAGDEETQKVGRKKKGVSRNIELPGKLRPHPDNTTHSPLHYAFPGKPPDRGYPRPKRSIDRTGANRINLK